MTLRKGVNNLLFLEHLSSQFDKEEPRAKRGYTRAMLCNLINMLLNKKLVTNKTKFGLINNQFSIKPIQCLLVVSHSFAYSVLPLLSLFLCVPHDAIE